MDLCTGRNKYRTPIDYTELLIWKVKAAHQPSTLLLGVFYDLTDFFQLLFYYISVMQSIV